jgi:hypothetical protein
MKIALMVVLCSAALAAQGTVTKDSSAAVSVGIAAKQRADSPSVAAARGAAMKDSSAIGGRGIVAAHGPDSLSASAAVPSSGQTKKITIIKKNIDYSLFVKLAIGMMCFIALFYTSAQTWNPG